ncbi:MAG: SIMPL domain-containing protein [Dehalococcoidales bacterium]|jgi:uncharacterized protein YggE
MKKRLLLAIGIALAIVAIGVVSCTSFPSSEPDTSGIIWSQQNRGIWVTGEGRVAVVPDVAILSLGIETQEAIVAEAQQQAATAMAAVMSTLDEHGVAGKDITTQYFSIQPVRRFDDGKEILLGYRVTNIVTVKVRNVEDTGSIIDAVTAAAGDYTRINSISFTVDDPQDYNEEAREKAMADAKAKAKQLADLGGVKLGKPTYINEYGGYISPVVFRDFGLIEGAATTPISPGETEIQLTVQVVYSIS